jgi:glutamate racemase
VRINVNILLFDSGMGGLSIYQEVRRRLPEHRYDYLFDNAFFPYGEQPEHIIVERCCSLITPLVHERQIDLVIIACNTASTVALPALRTALEIPIVGVVPAIKPAAALTRNHCIGLLATPATVQRPYTSQLITQFAADCQVLKLGVTELVIQAERKMAGYAVDEHAIRRALQPLTANATPPDTLVLGCTHFPLLKEELHRIMPGIQLVDSGAAIAKRVAALLQSTTATSTTYGQAYCTQLDDDAHKKSRILIEYGFHSLQLFELRN